LVVVALFLSVVRVGIYRAGFPTLGHAILRDGTSVALFKGPIYRGIVFSDVRGRPLDGAQNSTSAVGNPENESSTIDLGGRKAAAA
jgi:hypothetical protein